MTPTRSQLLHTRNVQLLIMLLLALSCIGFFVEMRKEAALKQMAAQGLLTPENTSLGLSGGRARGGSFNAPSAPSGSSGGGSMPRMDPSYGNSPSYGGGGYYPAPSYPSYPRTYPSYPRSGGTVIVPAPYPGGYGQTYPSAGVGSGFGTLFLLLVLGCMVLPLILNLIKLKAVGSPAAGGAGERLNDIVTVTELQVALLAQARTIQTDLDRIASRANLDDPVELNQMLQESVLALLRSPENWTHARVSSQTVRSREQAAQRFEQLSIAERSKFARETLVNIGGDVRRQTYTPRGDEDPAAYIVVTLLVGTADDQPLATQPIYSADDLQAVLKRLGSVSPSYLMVYELLWAPQDPSDSLSRDQLLTLYPDLTQIA